MRLPNTQIDWVFHACCEVKHLPNSRGINLVHPVGNPGFSHFQFSVFSNGDSPRFPTITYAVGSVELIPRDSIKFPSFSVTRPKPQSAARLRNRRGYSRSGLRKLI